MAVLKSILMPSSSRTGKLKLEFYAMHRPKDTDRRALFEGPIGEKEGLLDVLRV